MNYPLYEKLPYQSTVRVASVLSGESDLIFLDSSDSSPSWGRYSYLAYAAFATLSSSVTPLSLASVEKELQCYPLSRVEGLPPFQGGGVGYISYDTGNKDSPFPSYHFALYDCVIAFDHVDRACWIFSSGYPEMCPSLRYHRAQIRLAEVRQRLDSMKVNLPSSNQIERVELASNLSKEQYEQNVEKAIQYILEGDLFEANLSQCFSAPLPKGTPPFALYRRLRDRNPAPFSAFLRCGEVTIASTSPERFLKVEGGAVEARPIKGTTRRFSDPVKDREARLTLVESEKERAENVMIVDLMRNDLSKVCELRSIRVPQLCEVESYATLHHLVSVVTGKLRREIGLSQLIGATFPGGSITGAPKIRAMEVIHELEPSPRGPYCGCLGYIGFDGTIDLSMTIRSLIFSHDSLSFHAGGAITLSSDPAAEYQETLLKGEALIEALTCMHVDVS